MKELDLEAMPLDDLWTLHEAISKLLSERIIAEKQQLESSEPEQATRFLGRPDR